MAYDEGLADRVREFLAAREGVTERKMFGGLAFMVGGNMACGVMGDELMVRLDYEDADMALAEPHVRPMDFTGKPLRGMVYVGPEAIRSDDELASWVEMGADRAASLPAK